MPDELGVWQVGGGVENRRKPLNGGGGGAMVGYVFVPCFVLVFLLVAQDRVLCSTFS